MRNLTDEDHKQIYRIVCEVAGRNGVEGVELSGDADNPFSYFLEIISYRRKAIGAISPCSTIRLCLN